VQFQSQTLGFVANLDRDSVEGSLERDEQLAATLGAVGSNPPMTVPVRLLTTKQGTSGAGSNSLPLGYVCSAFLGTGAEQFLRVVRSAVSLASPPATNVSEVQPSTHGGISGFRFGYETPVGTAQWFSFDVKPWAVVCGGNYVAETRSAFLRMFDSMRRLDAK
jgi:hypothetical protein